MEDLQQSNKKILNSKKHTYAGINFKSLLEVNSYKKLETSGLVFEYEPEKVVLFAGFRPNNVSHYAPKELNKGKFSKLMLEQLNKIRDITYTPDFKIIYKDYIIYLDVKGYVNDTYPLKKKMFLKHLGERNDGFKYLFFEPHSMLQMYQTIEIIKSL